MLNGFKKLTKKTKNFDKNIVSQSQLAKLIGKTRQLVSIYAKDDRLVKSDIPGKYLAKESIERINQTKHLNGRAREWSIAGEKAAIDAKIDGVEYTDLKYRVSSKQLNLETTNARELFDNSRALREKSLALREAAEYEKFIGDLCKKEEVERVIFERGRQFRDSLMILARRISPNLVNKSNLEIEEILSEELRKTLISFTKLPVIE